MNSGYTQFNDYYKNQNNYIPTRYYCEAFASAEIAYFDVLLSSNLKTIKIDASQISSNQTISGPQSTQITFDADKITDIKSFNVFTWNGTSFTPAITAASTNPALFLAKKSNYYNTITIGRNGFTISSVLGAVNSSATMKQPVLTSDAKPSTDIFIARVYVTY